MNLDFYRSLYEDELKRRSAIETSVALPISTLTIIAGALYYLTITFNYRCDLVSHIFGVIIGLALVSFVISLYFIVRISMGYTYKILPLLSDLRTQHSSLVEYHLQTESTLENANHEFEEKLKNKYCESTDCNWWNNESKYVRLHLAKAFMTASLTFMILAAPFVAYDTIIQKKIVSIEIMNPCCLGQTTTKGESHVEQPAGSQETRAAEQTAAKTTGPTVPNNK